MKPTALFLILAVTACAGSGDDDAAPSAGQPGASPAGNVSFGGAQDVGEFRQILADGGIPAPVTLDSGGFFAEHYAEQPSADCGASLCPSVMTSVGEHWVTGEREGFVHVTLGSNVPAPTERPPLDLVLVVDTSGSMATDRRLDDVKAGIKVLLGGLRPEDRLALVTYSGEAQVVIPLGEVIPEQASAAVDNMFPHGSTNLYNGLQEGFGQLLYGLPDTSRQRRVLLLSDGLPTAGEQNEYTIIAMARDAAIHGFALSTIGIGRDFGTTLMRGLAEEGAGSFYFLEDASAIEEVFTEELDTLLIPLALDVQLVVSAAAGLDLIEVMGTTRFQPTYDYCTRTRSTRLSPPAPNCVTGGSLSLPAVFSASRTSDDPGAGGRRGGGSALILRYRLREDAPWNEALTSVQASLSFRDPATDETITSTTGPDLSGYDAAQRYFSHEAMAEHYAMANLYMGLRDASVEASAGDFDCAAAILTELDHAAMTFNAERADEDIAHDRELIAQFAANLRTNSPYALGEADAATCRRGSYEPWPGDDYHDEHHHRLGCNVTSPASSQTSPWAAWLLLAVPAMLMLATRMRFMLTQGSPRSSVVAAAKEELRVGKSDLEATDARLGLRAVAAAELAGQELELMLENVAGHGAHGRLRTTGR